MPRMIDHPRASFRNAQEIAAAVDYLGGSCTLSSCAEKMGKKVSGAFKALVSSSVTHGLVTIKREILTTTDLFRTLKLAYNEDEKTQMLRKAFLFPPLYQKIYDRFKGKDLPIAMLDKLLIRELGVEAIYGSRVAGYFIEGAKGVKILDNGKLVDNLKIVGSDSDDQSDEEDYNEEKESNSNSLGSLSEEHPVSIVLPSNSSDSFVISISGPGMNTKIVINEEDDLLILDAILNKVRKNIKEDK